MIPQIQSNTENVGIEIQSQPSKTYNDREKYIIGYIDGLKSITQTVKHILHKERYAYQIYPDWYGMELEKYKGQPFEYLEAQIERDLKSALMQDDRIYDVVVDTIEQVDIDAAHIVFRVFSTEGINREEATINV